MFYLWYEYLSESYPRFNISKLRDQHQLMSYTLHEPLADIIKQSYEYPKYDHFFLLDESRFSFFRCDIFQTFDHPITIQELNILIKEHTQKTKQEHNLDGEVITTYIDTIYVNGDEKKFLIGQSGEVFFRLYIMYISKTTLNNFNAVYGNIFDYPKLNIVPQSFYTMLFLRNNLKKENFVLLYINENYCKAVQVKNGFYDNFEIINLGLSSLKQMYKDNGVAQFWYKDYHTIESNSLAKELVLETLEFYSQLFCKWLDEKKLIGTDIIVISPITKNAHFIESFDKEYRKHTNNYIVPFHHSHLLKTFDKERDPEDMDTLVFLNQDKTIKNMLLGKNE